jgi:hypothetical protein
MKIYSIRNFFVLISILALFSNGELNAQSESFRKAYFGQVINMFNGYPLENAHVINLSSTSGTITNYRGEFRIEVAVGDTLFISQMGFHSKKIIIDEKGMTQNNLIKLITQNYELDEVVVSLYDLTGILEIDVKNLVVDNRKKVVKFKGLKTSDELGPNRYDKPSVFQPVDFIYNIFGDKPKQLRKLKKLQEQDQVRNLLYYKYDREFLMETLGLSRKQIEAILKYCNYDKEYIEDSNDLEILKAVLDCYEEYKKFYSEDEDFEKN